MNRPAFKDRHGRYIRTLTIERERSITSAYDEFIGDTECHCALGFFRERGGWFIAPREVSVASEWGDSVANANDFINNRQRREKKLTELFAEKGIKLKFKGERYSRRGRNR